MAPPTLYRRPNEQLVALLASARGDGLSFEQAWKRAVRPDRPLVLTNAEDPPYGAVMWPTDSADRNAWRTAILAMKDEHRRAYERRPQTVRERSVVILIEILGGGFEAADGIHRPAAVRSAA
jgi:hypothetical protein